MSYKKQRKQYVQVKRRTTTTTKTLHLTGKRKSQAYALAKDLTRARKKFAAMSPRSQSQDLRKLAPIAPNIQAWLHSPNHFDIPSVDTPSSKNIAELAKKQDIEVWLKNGKEKLGKSLKRYSIKKSDINEVKKPTLTDTKEPKKSKEPEKEKATNINPVKRSMPSKEEIEAEAYRLYSMDNQNNENITTSPERAELAEEGYLKEAQRNLMASGKRTSWKKRTLEI